MNWVDGRQADPLQLTPKEQWVDDLLAFENFERYCAQSATTGINAPAPLPPRPATAGAH